MSAWRNFLRQLLDPRSKLEKIPSMADAVEEVAEGLGGARRGRLRPRDILTNIPFLLGALIVFGLFLLALFGPVWAPKNPYLGGQFITPHFDIELNEFVSPPFPPSEEFPLGTDQFGADLLSLLMHGARNTLVAAAFITFVRVVLGLALGGVAGWNEGKLSDRLIMGLVGLLTSLPLLISTMILVYALDIRRGLLVFIVALSVLGWTEIAQYTRGEFQVLRKRPFIEGAYASGLNPLQIGVRHILPNVLPQILVITFLEMGAVLLLLGELGFVGVFVGGGVKLDLTEAFGPSNVVTLPETPEWAAMIANGYAWLRSQPHVVTAPAIAMFTAIVGFNMLGEGFRRLVEVNGLDTSFLLRREMLAVVGGLSFATVFIMNNTGPAPWFSRVAESFDGDAAYEHVEALTEMEGRGLGQPGALEASSYIVERFQAYGLNPGWKDSSYFYTVESQIVRPVEQPALQILNENGEVIAEFHHQLDFGYVIAGHGGSGSAQTQVVFVGFDPERGEPAWPDYKGLDLRGKIALVYEGNAPANFATEALIRGAVGVIRVTGEGRDDVRSQIQIPVSGAEFFVSPQIPILRVRPAVGEAILNQAGTDFSGLFSGGDDVTVGTGWLARELDVTLAMSVLLGEAEDFEIPSVIGYLPGNDFSIARQMVVLFAEYDGLGIDPDGTVYPAANHNAAGVSVLLEMARLWQEQELEPRRSVLFVAWGGASLDDSGATAWIENRISFRHLLAANNAISEPTFFVQLDYVGAGGDTLLIHPDSNDLLVELFQGVNAEEFNLEIALAEDTPAFTEDIVTQQLGWISFRWADQVVSPTEDDLREIDEDKLQTFGEFFSLALTQIVREASLR